MTSKRKTNMFDISVTPFGVAFADWAYEQGGDPDQAESSAIYWTFGFWSVELALLSFREWDALDAVTLALHKPKIRPGTQRIGIELNWTRADYDIARSPG